MAEILAQFPQFLEFLEFQPEELRELSELARNFRRAVLELTLSLGGTRRLDVESDVQIRPAVGCEQCVGHI
jgi:hypothetical protein